MRTGDVFAGKYRIERELGRGGMGVVVAARHIKLDERVAIKVLLPELASREDLAARFLREARAAAKVRGEHVARVLDVDEANGTPYIVMEYLDGASLDAVLSDGGPVDPRRAVDWILQALEALAEAHALGIVHRDLKPGNLFLADRADGSQRLKVLDFGISKFQRGAEEDPELTDTHHVLGTPEYMAPEQLQSAADVDARTDIWAIGAVLYELVEGRRPFVDLGALVAGRMTQLERAGAELHVAIARCLEKDRVSRFADVSELASALAPFGGPDAGASAERVGRVLRRRMDMEATLPVPPPSDALAPGDASTPRMAPRALAPRKVPLPFAPTEPAPTPPIVATPPQKKSPDTFDAVSSDAPTLRRIVASVREIVARVMPSPTNLRREAIAVGAILGSSVVVVILIVVFRASPQPKEESAVQPSVTGISGPESASIPRPETLSPSGASLPPIVLESAASSSPTLDGAVAPSASTPKSQKLVKPPMSPGASGTKTPGAPHSNEDI